ncbi:MAG: hypothetical protein IKZ04_06860, partial [Spirochaetaceae bacterium]|nr:hypothetical protein [Spirochaetaceae bacterium]
MRCFSVEIRSISIFNAPIERINSEHKYFLLTDESSTTVSHKSNIQNSCTVIRAKFDRWCMEEAKKAGAYFVPNT